MSSSLNTGSASAEPDTEGVMRALAELVLRRPSAGSFVTYARGVVLMGFAGGVARVAFFAIPVVIVALVVGWRVVSRRRVREQV